MLILHRESFREQEAIFSLLAGVVPAEWGSESEGQGGGREPQLGGAARESEGKTHTHAVDL